MSQCQKINLKKYFPANLKYRELVKNWFCAKIHTRENKVYYSSVFDNNRDVPREIAFVCSNLSPTWSCVSMTRFTASKLFRFDKEEVIDFEILLIDVTFYLSDIQELVL